MYSGRTSILGRAVLVLVGLLQPLFPLFVQIFTTTVSITMRWPELLSYLEINITHYTIILRYLLRKNIYTWERGAGLGWVVAASFSVICPDFHYNSFNLYVMARTSLLLGNEHKTLHHPVEVCIKIEQVYLGEGCWTWLGCCSLFFHYLSRFSLQLFQLLCNGQNFPLIGK
jgi:hypothetical protein